jgi:hypothetical protein
MNLNNHCPERDKPDPPPEEVRPPEIEEAERLALLGALKEQVRKGVYRPDIRDLARSLACVMVRQL